MVLTAAQDVNMSKWRVRVQYLSWFKEQLEINKGYSVINFAS